MWQHLQRRVRTAITLKQCAECARPDILGTDQPQPGNALGIGQAVSGWRVHHPFAPILLSVPAISRAILARCMNHNSALRIANSRPSVGELYQAMKNGVNSVATSADADE